MDEKDLPTVDSHVCSTLTGNYDGHIVSDDNLKWIIELETNIKTV